ncbi:hypothetical protein HKX48_006249 [Thoreauomyces humboldtii]|nr:hypothetical protein HKX48_006249 [Thoreauomyces humboldtii]
MAGILGIFTTLRHQLYNYPTIFFSYVIGISGIPLIRRCVRFRLSRSNLAKVEDLAKQSLTTPTPRSSLGPVMLLTVYPARREMGFKVPVDAPRSYPLPEGPRSNPSGYED